MVKAMIEMTAGDTYKYEVSEWGLLTLDRPLAVAVPANYGFVPNTKAEDGDAIDIFVVSKHPLPRMVQAQVEIIAAYKCVDNGVKDDKFIAVLVGETHDSFFIENEAVQIENYLRSYKKGFVVKGYLNKADANQAFVAAKEGKS